MSDYTTSQLPAVSVLQMGTIFSVPLYLHQASQAKCAVLDGLQVPNTLVCWEQEIQQSISMDLVESYFKS